MQRAEQEVLAKVLEPHKKKKRKRKMGVWLASRDVIMPQGVCLIPFMGPCSFIR